MPALLLASPREAGAEIARRANDFIDSIGVNTHLNDVRQFYSYALFGELGVRHFRDNMPPSSGTDGFLRLTDLYNGHGIRCNLCCDRTDLSATQWQPVMEYAMFESIEGLNEPDIAAERSYFTLQDDWATRDYEATLEFQKDLYDAINGDSATQHKPVLSPAMAYPERTRGLRGSGKFDWVAAHSYDSGHRSTAALLDSTALPSALLINAPGGPVPPLVLTEIGWTSPETIPDAVGAKYIPRVLAECFKRGLVRTYLFEMCDFPESYNYGLIRHDGTVKPAYGRLKNLITHVGEGTWNSSEKAWENIPDFSPGELDYTMSAENENVRHLLLQKGDGDFYLLLWQEAQSYDVVTSQTTSPPPAAVKLAFNTAIASTAVYDLTSLTPAANHSAPREFSLTVPDEIVVVKITPEPNPVATHPAVTIVATDAVASISNSSDTGEFRVHRTGDTGSAMTVTYRVDGSAVAGVQYAALSGTVQIPAGSSHAPISVVTTGTGNIHGRPGVIVTLTGTAYGIGPNYTTATVHLQAGSDVADDFEDGNLVGWSDGQHSSVALTNSPVDSGSGALEWTFIKSGSNAWGNDITLTFATPRDLRTVSKVLIRFAEDPGNAAAPAPPNDAEKTMRQPIYFDFTDANGASVTGGQGVVWFHIFNEPGYRTIELPLGTYPRSQVKSLKFYVNGDSFSAGTYVWYIDDISFVTERDAELAGFEDGSTQYLAAQSRSTLEINSPGASCGWRSLKWTYHDNGATQWNNQVYLHFPRPLDLTKKRKLALRFHADSSNPVSDAGKTIYLDILNEGVSASGGAGVANWPLAASAPGFHTIELDLGDAPRHKVTSLSLYVNGNDFATGDHIWYLDSVSAY